MEKLVLLVEHDRAARRTLRRMLEQRGYALVEAVTARAALELLQRLPDAFAMVLVQTTVRGLPGTALVETLRLFRPEMPVFCLSTGGEAPIEVGCPTLSDGGEELDVYLRLFQENGTTWSESTALSPDWVRRVRERYARTTDLVEAAYEVARALDPG